MVCMELSNIEFTFCVAPTDSSVSACEEDLVSPTSCRKLWEDNGDAVCPEYGPPSMTQV